MTAAEKATSVPQPPESEHDEDSLFRQTQDWIRNQAPWWATSFMLHMFALSTLLLIGHVITRAPADEPPAFESVAQVPASAEAELDRFPITEPQVDTGMLRPEDLLVPNGDPGTPDGATVTGTFEIPRGDAPPSGSTASHGPPLPGMPGVGDGPKPRFGPGDNDRGLGGPGNNPYGSRPKHGGVGKTRLTETAVQAGINWLYRHQGREGNWSLREYQRRCVDKTCTGPAGEESFSAATALGVLPFLAAGQTHLTGLPRYRQTVFAALYWLKNHQAADGDLSAGASAQMYSHALATIALCEAYGMTRDKALNFPAQRAINFIQAAQNSKTGGWRYHPGEEGDTSVVGWQMMALKSGQLAGLVVNQASYDGTKRWLQLVGKSAPGGSSGAAGNGQFSYQPDGVPTPTMSAVGLLCNQYLHVSKNDPVIVGGVQHLMGNSPSENARNMYYWYYATQVLHNMLDKDWDTWNYKMRDILVHEQIATGCATGSWDPDQPTRDAWGPQGGRVMMTGLATLTLEVYYRNLAVYKNGETDALEAIPSVVKPAPGKGGAVKID